MDGGQGDPVRSGPKPDRGSTENETKLFETHWRAFLGCHVCTPTLYRHEPQH